MAAWRLAIAVLICLLHDSLLVLAAPNATSILVRWDLSC
jgi:hypothetical protein